MTAVRARLSDGRLHLSHGPIDVVIAADGEAGAIAAAEAHAWRRFEPLLDELVAELPSLRAPVGDRCPLAGAVARRMWTACAVHRARFVTPMAAVAGAVADTLVESYRRPGIRRASINNGGDIAFHLGSGASLRVGLYADLARFDGAAASRALDGRFVVDAASPVRGIATSGWRGRSFSFGIADSVTVLARTAADADAAATMIANEVDVDDARIVRRPATSIRDDSDLGDRPVTVDVPALGRAAAHRAVAAGLAHAETLAAAGVIFACAIVCQGVAASTDGAADAGVRFDPALRIAA